MLEQGVSADQFYRFMIDFGIQDNNDAQQVLNQLIATEASSNPSSRLWTINEADDLLELLKSPEKSKKRAPL